MSIARTRGPGVAVLVAGLALALAACVSSGGATTAPASRGASPPVRAAAASAAVASAGPTAVSSPDVPAVPSLERTAGPSLEPTETALPPGSTPESTSDPFAGLNHDADLEARLPDTFGGAKLQKFTVSGADMPDDPQGTAYLKSIGKTSADMSLAGAIAAGGDPVFSAIRVKGTTEDQLRTLFLQSAQRRAAEGSSVKIELTSLDGVEGFKTSDPATGQVSYFVVRGDTALGVSSGTDAQARKAFAALAK